MMGSEENDPMMNFPWGNEGDTHQQFQHAAFNNPTPSSAPAETPNTRTDDPQFDIFEWYPKYQSCQKYFVDHAQRSGPVQAVAAFINIFLPSQRPSNPVSASEPRLSPGGLMGRSNPLPHQSHTAVSLVPYLRRLVVTGLDFPGVLHGFFGDDWASGVGLLHEQERRNYLFAAKSGGWASVKKDYDMLPLETVPFMRPLQNPVNSEIEAAEKSWSEWLAMEDWMVGPRAPENLESGNNQAKFRFSDLPAELQLLILELILLPGDIHLQVYTERWGYGSRTVETLYRAVAPTSNIDAPVPKWVQQLESLHLKYPSERFRQIGGSPKEQQPGFGLIAMGKFIYQKGYPIFYGQNTFHIAPGLVNLSTHYFSTLLPSHRNLIKSLAVTFTSADLTREGFQEVESDIKYEKTWRGLSFKHMGPQEQVRIWTAKSIEVLQSTWRQKIEWLLTWPQLESIMLSGPTWELLISGQDMAQLLGEAVKELNEPVPSGRLGTIRGCLQQSVDKAREELLAGFAQRGQWKDHSYLDERGVHVFLASWKLDVEGAKEWLNGFGPGVRYKPEPRRGLQLRVGKEKTAFE